MSSRAESDFLCKFFSVLNENGVSYAVMRNHETLPYSCRDTDLDVLVNPDHGRSFLSILKKVIADSEATLLGETSAPGFRKVFVLGKNSKYAEHWWGLRLDVNIGLKYKGLSLLNDSHPLSTTIHNDIYVLSDGFSAVLGVLKEVLNNGVIPERYVKTARSFVTTEWESVEKLLMPMGDNSLALIKKAIMDKPRGEKALCIGIRNSFFRHVLSDRPLEFVRGRAHSMGSRILRYLSPSGTVVAILGADGAGKSTIIDSIKPFLDQATHNAVVVRHLRPNFLPPLSKFKGGNKATFGPVTDPHGSRPSGSLGSLIRISYATLNYVLGYWFETRFQIAKQPNVVIFDRYAYDMGIDPARFRISLPPSVTRAFVRLAPKPDLIFCLIGSPGVLVARKRELPLEEVARQVEALKAFTQKERRAIAINTENSVEDCSNQILQSLADYCRERSKA